MALPRIPKNILNQTFTFNKQVLTSDGIQDTGIDYTVECYSEVKTMKVNNPDGFKIEQATLIMFDNEDISTLLTVGDTIKYNGRDYVILDFENFNPYNEYHHTEMTVK